MTITVKGGGMKQAWRGAKEQAAAGFEPANNGFANRRLRPLGYAANPVRTLPAAPVLSETDLLLLTPPT